MSNAKGGRNVKIIVFNLAWLSQGQSRSGHRPGELTSNNTSRVDIEVAPVHLCLTSSICFWLVSSLWPLFALWPTLAVFLRTTPRTTSWAPPFCLFFPWFDINSRVYSYLDTAKRINRTWGKGCYKSSNSNSIPSHTIKQIYTVWKKKSKIERP